MHFILTRIHPLRRLVFCFVLLGIFGFFVRPIAASPDIPTNTLYQPLPFTQDWSNITLINESNNWSNVPGIVGYRGDNTGTATNVNPQTLLAPSYGAENVLPNLDYTGFTTGGLGEFEITDPVVALQGTITADAPNLVIYVNTLGNSNIHICYDVRDIDSMDNAVQQIALHYRVGESGNFTNLPAGYIADATLGPGDATLVTSRAVLLPPAADNQPQVQLRIMTTNAAGPNEWVGIDNIRIAGDGDCLALDVELGDFTAEVEEGGVRVAWETYSETDTLGFHLSRATNPTAPTERITSELIPASPGGQGDLYDWLDEKVTSGATYYYWLEVMDINGAIEQHGPVSVELPTPTAVTLTTFGATPNWNVGGMVLLMVVVMGCIRLLKLKR